MSDFDYQNYSEERIPIRTLKPRTEPLWRTHDQKAQKSGQRGTIYWVGKGIIGEDGTHTGSHAKGTCYHGQWENDKKNGYGVQDFPNGEKYEGQWGNGQRNGEGTLWIPTGKAKKLRKLYVGGWQDDRRHGRGTCFFKNGQFFQGCWDQGKMHGKGTLRYANGDLYIGDWDNGLRSGQGTLTKANGDCYEGYWLNDKREGSGSYFYAESGKVFVGEWADDLPKAGVYTQANPNPEQATAVPTTSVLPPVRLALPVDVLEGALAAVRNSRKSYRAQQTPISRLFAKDEMDALRGAFDGVQKDELITPEDLAFLCSSLGAEVTPQRVAHLLHDAGYGGNAAEPATNGAQVYLTFEDFLRVVALLLDEEAALPAEGSQDEMTGDAGGMDFFDKAGDEDYDYNLGDNLEDFGL